LEALNTRRFLGAFGPMMNFKRMRAYKNVHKAKLRFSPWQFATFRPWVSFYGNASLGTAQDGNAAENGKAFVVPTVNAEQFRDLKTS
jgi:hypothetical protein